jgi:micrococcal nuclease
MKKINYLGFITLISIIFSLNVYANTKETVKFKKCVDGDTAVFILNNEEVKVRFLAIDTPETVHPNMAVQPYGKNASEYTCTKITKAQKIVLEFDDGSTKLDKYGRTLAWVWVNDSLLQKELISVGYAKVKYIYGKYAYTDELYEEQAKAKEAKLGLWSDYVPVTYIVSFDEGNNKINKVKVNEDETVTSYIPKRNGYNFIGWYYNNKKFDFKTKITSNITLKAKYEETYDYVEIIVGAIILIGLYFTNKKAFKRKLKKLV